LIWKSIRRISEMRYVYPYEIEKDGSTLVVSFPDIPGALTQVDPGENFDAVVRDCLVAALGGYAELRQRPPRPSVARGRSTTALDVLLSAKLALVTAMIEAGVTNVELARKLRVSEKVARRLRDLDHPSRIDRLEAALACLGQQLELSVRSIPCATSPRQQSNNPSARPVRKARVSLS
jgi:antitoxin HicB